VQARATGGNCLLWGRKPRMITARYTTERGEVKSSLLLVDGWWRVSRHFHYLPELAAAFCWSAPAGFTHFLPYFYLAFLTPLLFDRGACGRPPGRGGAAGMMLRTVACALTVTQPRAPNTCCSVPRRRPLQGQVRQVLGRVLQGGALQDDPLHLVSIHAPTRGLHVACG
jgi:hypothetical protein